MTDFSIIEKLCDIYERNEVQDFLSPVEHHAIMRAVAYILEGFRSANNIEIAFDKFDRLSLRDIMNSMRADLIVKAAQTRGEEDDGA